MFFSTTQVYKCTQKACKIPGSPLGISNFIRCYYRRTGIYAIFLYGQSRQKLLSTGSPVVGGNKITLFCKKTERIHRYAAVFLL